MLRRRIADQPALRRYRHRILASELDLPRASTDTTIRPRRSKPFPARCFNLHEQQGLGFIPLHGERDEEHQFGVTIPYRGWVLDADNFQTNVQNFLDHNNIGESSIFFPDHHLAGPDSRLGSSRSALRASRIAANFISPTPTRSPKAAAPSPAASPISRCISPDCRRSITTSATRSTSAATSLCPGAPTLPTNVYYGSGFSNAFPGQPYPGNYLPQHTTFDLSLGKDFGERFSASLTALNVANRRVELRQQPHLRRIPLEQSARNLCGGSLSLPLLEPRNPQPSTWAAGCGFGLC